MRAISQTALGTPEVLKIVDRPMPELDEGKIRIKVTAAGVNPADARIRSGEITRFGAPPFTVGLDFSGIVDAIFGDDRSFDIGERVFGVTFPPHGSYSEYVVASVEHVARQPSNVDAIHAAALPVTSLTAWQALTKAADVQPGERVLIHAAAGGVGHLAVQIAAYLGAYVIATARTVNHEFLRELGVQEVIDYSERDFREMARNIDVVIDPLSGENAIRSLDVLRGNGRLIDVRGSGIDRTAVRRAAEQRNVKLVEFGFTPQRDDLDTIVDLVERGALRVAVEHVFPLEHAMEAHEIIDSGYSRGKIVLKVAQ